MKTRTTNLHAALLLLCAGCFDLPTYKTPDKNDAVHQLYAAQPNCLGLDDSCSSGLNHCCKNLACGSSCCVIAGAPCQSDANCCSHSCVFGKCACAKVGSACSNDGECCASDQLECAAIAGHTGRCTIRPGGPCHQDYDCVSDRCGAGGTCSCSGGTSGVGKCFGDADCCPGLVCGAGYSSEYGSCCLPSGSNCQSGSDCCSHSCDNQTGSCR